jgi:hypothetical protein
MREIADERWPLLILRDAFHGVRRFTDFHTDLKDPTTVVAQCLSLIAEEVLLGLFTSSAAKSRPPELRRVRHPAHGCKAAIASPRCSMTMTSPAATRSKNPEAWVRARVSEIRALPVS